MSITVNQRRNKRRRARCRLEVLSLPNHLTGAWEACSLDFNATVGTDGLRHRQRPFSVGSSLRIRRPLPILLWGEIKLHYNLQHKYVCVTVAG